MKMMKPINFSAASSLSRKACGLFLACMLLGAGGIAQAQTLTLRVSGITSQADLAKLQIEGLSDAFNAIGLPYLSGTTYQNNVTQTLGATIADEQWHFTIDSIPPGYEFSGWSTNGRGIDPDPIATSITLQLDSPPPASTTLLATFRQVKPTLKVSIYNDPSTTPGVGSVKVGTAANAPNAKFDEPVTLTNNVNTTVTLTPSQPGTTGYAFAYFAINDSTMGYPPHPGVRYVTTPTPHYEITIGTDNEEVVGVFAPVLKITQNNTDAFGMTKTTTVAMGQTGVVVAPPLTSVPDTDGSGAMFVLTGWSDGTGDIPANGTAMSFTIAEVTTNSTITWKWDRRIPLDVYAGTGGTVLGQPGPGVYVDPAPPTGSLRYWISTTVTNKTLVLEARPESGDFHFKDWTSTFFDPQNNPRLVIPSSADGVAVPTAAAIINANFQPVNPDSNGDGIPDWWCLYVGLDPFAKAGDKSMAGEDPDNDGLTNLQEYMLTFSNKTSIIVCDPLNWDTDYDGMDDGWEAEMFGNDPANQGGQWIPAPMDPGTRAPDGRYGPNGNPDYEKGAEIGDYLWDTANGWEMAEMPLTNIMEYRGPDGIPPRQMGVVTNFTKIVKSVRRAVKNDGDESPEIDTGDGSHPMMVDTDRDKFDDGFEYSWDKWQISNGHQLMTNVARWPGITNTVDQMVGGTWTNGTRPFHPNRFHDYSNVDMGYIYDVTTGRPTKPYSDMEEYLVWNNQDPTSIPLVRDDKPADSTERWCTNPFVWDTDHDGLPDGWEIIYGYNPWKRDTDNNGTADPDENPDKDVFAVDRALGLRHHDVYVEHGFDPRTPLRDPDNPNRIPKDAPYTDWYTNYDELVGASVGVISPMSPFVSIAEMTLENQRDWLSSGPQVVDFDGDGMYDTWEMYVGLNPFIATDSGDDPDEDGLSNIAEFQSAMTPPPLALGTLGPVPQTAPAYRVPGWFNKTYPTDPWNPDTDGDQLGDGGELGAFNVGVEPDGGWVTFACPGDAPAAKLLARNGGLCPTSVDTDGDYMPDAWEALFGSMNSAVGVSTNIPGLNGTLFDAYEDADQDGLLNYQEYMVGSIGHWQFQSNMGVPLWDSSKGLNQFDPYDFFDITKSGGSYNIDRGGLGAKVWDPHFDIGPITWSIPYRFLSAAEHPTGLWYSTADPMNRDTDEDGMDDYWEVFHGLNPLYGTLDIVRSKVSGMEVLSSLSMDLDEANFIVGWPPDLRERPWLAGFQYTDSDQDGICDLEESLQPNNETPPFHHSDPSPLWMTDISSPDSFVNKFYWTGSFGLFQGSSTLYRQWPWSLPFDSLVAPSYMFTFEMNEGFDTDGDFLADRAELSDTPESIGATDPTDTMSPPRRRTLYLDGIEAAARTMPQYSHDVWDLRQFTVDAWIRPELPKNTAHEQTILERVGAIPQGSSDLTSTAVRANFRLGIDKEGHPFAEYNGSQADTQSPTPRATGKIELKADTWYHLTATYSGDFHSSGFWSGILTLYVNGVSAGTVNSSVIPMNGWTISVDTAPLNSGYLVPMPIVVGASDANPAGWVNGSSILVGPDTGMSFTPPVLKNYYKGHIDQVRVWRAPLTAAQINQQKNVRYGKASDIAALAVAPQDGGLGLLYCYTFDNLVDPVNSAVYPLGFEMPGGRPLSYTGAPFWSQSPVRSQYYDEYRYVPWIKNLVAHIPLDVPRDMGMPDGTQQDPNAQYPNTWNPYGLVYTTAPLYGEEIHPLISSGSYADVFQDMGTVSAYPDLLPLLWARADENVVMWDGMTGTDPLFDLDGDGLPDEWELAHGGDPTSRYTYGDEIADGDADWDNDGLPNWVEYVLDLNPRAADSDGNGISDYDDVASRTDAFKFIDMDFMEDWWELKYRSYYISPSRYDPHLDRDEDGWDNWSETRARTRPDAAASVDANGPKYEHPVPVLNVKIWCDSVNRSGNVVIHGYSTPTMDGVPDAVYTVQLGQTIAVPQFVMELNSASAFSGRFLPGHIMPNTVMMQTTDLASGALLTIQDIVGEGGGFGYLVMTIPVLDPTTGEPTNYLVDVGTIDYLTGVYELDSEFLGMGSWGVAYSYNITPNWPAPVSFSIKDPDSFDYSLRQGDNYFFAFLDNNGNGTWDPGEPASLADQNMRASAKTGKGLSGMDIGWHENDLDFGLRGAMHGYPRFSWSNPNTAHDSVVAISRMGTHARPLFSRNIKGPRNYFHEGDMLYAEANANGYGLDWGFEGDPSSLTNSYQIVVSDPVAVAGGLQLMTTNFITGYPATSDSSQRPELVYPRLGSIFEMSELEFRWKMSDQMTAFRLEIKRGGSVVYDSGVLPPPYRRRLLGVTSPSVVVFKPQLYANQLVAGATYQWQIYLYTPPRTGATGIVTSNAETFTVTDRLGQLSGTFAINVDINYYSQGTGARTLYVEAFKNAGFSGLPVARSVYALPATRPARFAATLAGLDSQESYYVRAYIRSNTGDSDALRKGYDSWGYVCAPEMNGWKYDPLRITDIRPVPRYSLSMYDTDVNMNQVADLREGVSFSTMGVFTAEEFMQLLAINTNPIDSDGDGISDSIELEYGTDPKNVSSGNDGISDATRIAMGLSGTDPIQLMIQSFSTTGQQPSIQWTLGTSVSADSGMQTMSAEPAAPVFAPMSDTVPFRKDVRYIIERTETLGKDAKWVEVGSITTNGPLGSIALPVDSTKRSGFYRIKLLEIPAAE